MTGAEKRLLFWVVGFALFIAGLIWLRGILLPFVAGAILAYFLDPLADRMQRVGISRMIATLLIVFVFAVLLIITLMLLVPFVAREFKDLVLAMPEQIENLRNIIGHYYKTWFGRDLSDFELGFDEAVRRFADSSSLKMGELVKHLWSGGLALVNIISLFVITPVVAFYLLLDWDKMIERVDGWLPRAHANTLRDLARQIDQMLNGFVRGQVTVCIILAAFYSIGLTIVGLKHGFLIGLIAGVLSFIPYVGSAVGLLLSFGMAIGQFWPEWVPIVMVLGVFFTGQLIEGNFLQPKIVGDKVNLHPLWLIFALFVFGYLMGFVGMLIAVPLAATIGVLVRFALARYLESDFYRGQ